jgi:hypothetical protein
MNNIDDQRNSLRRRTIFGGVLFDDGGQNWECSVSDISETGVKIRSKSAELNSGDQVELKINKFNDLRRCEVTWVRENEYGLRFLVAITANDGEMANLFKFARGKR